MASKSSNSVAIGIDLGTTYSCIGVWENGRAEIIVNDQGNRITPSYVAFNDTEMMTGDAAKNQITINHENTIFCAKRLIGHSFNDKNVKEDIEKLPFRVLKRDGKLVIQVELKNEITYLTPEEVSSHLLSYLRKTAESYIGKPVRDAVITVPAYFNNSQRKSTIDAGKLAGLNVLSILNEPTAAAIAYGIKNRESKKRIVLVFDLGGGTFDISLLNIISENFKVLATVGDAHLGGTDFDTRLVDYFVRLFKKKTRYDISNNSRSLSRLRSQVERAKCILSSQTRSSIEIDSIYKGIDFQESLTRAKFEDLCQDLFLSTMDYLDKIFLDSGIEKHQVDDIVLVGGSTRICNIQSLVSEYFSGRQLQKSINPDEAVACGATIQATMLTKPMSQIIKDIVLVDITPISLGIETVGSVMNIVVPRNTALPFKITKRFTTVYDYQISVLFTVYEGESNYSLSNSLLGQFVLNGLPLAPKGVPNIDVTFTVDTNGLLNVKAYSLESGISNNINIVYNRNRSLKAKTGNFIQLEYV